MGKSLTEKNIGGASCYRKDAGRRGDFHPGGSNADPSKWSWPGGQLRYLKNQLRKGFPGQEQGLI